jgi:hypothetical protein
MPRVVFIVTTHVTNKKQLDLLFECLFSIYDKHPDAAIQVLDDTHARSECLHVPEYCKIEKTRHPACGEVNAYIWAMEHRSEYDVFIYIHDSCKVLSKIPYTLYGCNYNQFWYAGANSHLDTTGSNIDNFMNTFTVFGKDCKHDLELVCAGRGNLIFGTMAVFDSVFLNFLETNTNFKDVAHLLEGRPLRCFFERLMYIIVSKFTGKSDFFYNAFCGDIFNHTRGFSNDTFETYPNNPYLVKVWQYR